MGQTTSAAAAPGPLDGNHSDRLKHKSKAASFPMRAKGDDSSLQNVVDDAVYDYISNLPDECLACVFRSLGSGDRSLCSLVCHRWRLVEGQSRQRLSLNAQSDLLSMIPSLFDRFDVVTKLTLKCDRRSVSIGDDALILISLRCRNLTRLKLRACRELTAAGLAIFAKNCRGLKKLSCGSCTFGAKGMNAVLENSSSLEELSVRRLHCITDGAPADPIGPGIAASSLKTIRLKELYNAQSFGPLIIGSKNLRTLKIFRCSGRWDNILEQITDRVTSMVEIHLERLQVGDNGLAAISKCSRLEILHLVKTPECTNFGLISVATNCKLLRKLHIDGWKTNRISDDGLIAVAKHCPNLQELVLISVNPTRSSIELLAVNCQKLERLALCGSQTVGDEEISCIAAKCGALKKLCIKSCPVSDHGMEALAGGCPNLVKVKVRKCRGVTSEGADWLKGRRGSMAIVNLDTSDDGGDLEPGSEMPTDGPPLGAANAATIVAGRSRTFIARVDLVAGRNSVTGVLRRCWSFSGSSCSN